MSTPFFALLSNKFRSFQSYCRITVFKLKGMQVCNNVDIGRIRCDWPHKLKIGQGTIVEDGVTFWIKEPFNLDNCIALGEKVFIGRNTEFNCSSKITVGDNCLIASKTVIVDVGHEHFRNQVINIQPLIKKEIIIEEDVWIGTSCTILKGVVLGKGCIIGANSLVNKSVPPYEIWAGSPAHKIGERT